MNRKVRCTKENEIIQKLAEKVLEVVDKGFGAILKTKSKSAVRDVVSSLDKKLDMIITKKLTSSFGDSIMSEESSPDIDLYKERVWVVDPLCGSRSASRGIRMFSTNITLVEDGEALAAWVVDHNRKRVIWGLGNKIIYSNKLKVPRLEANSNMALVNIDWGHFFELGNHVMQRYATFARDIIARTDIHVYALDTSLGLAYVSTGQLHAATIINTYPWDFLAASFLIEQNGGVVSNFDGKPWGVKSKSLVMAANKKLHQTLLELIRKNKLRYMG